MDYRRFLGQSEEVTAPVVGRDVWLRERRVRLGGDGRSGWWRVRVRGRAAEPIAPAGSEEIAGAMASLPRVRGHVLRAHGGLALVDGQAGCQPLELAPADEDPPLLAPVSARRWPTGDLLRWEQVDWEGEGEEQARRALEDRVGLAQVKGISSALRAAFALATAQAASQALGIAAEPAEVKRWIAEIADQGRPRAEAVLRALAEERARWAPPPVRVVPRPPRQVAAEELEGQVEVALGGAGARLLSMRRQGGATVEVRWMFQGQRFTSVVAEDGLRVIDAGICLAGEDDRVTLASLPGVIREAIDEEALVITRHVWDR
jgi:hypothetical protein